MLALAVLACNKSSDDVRPTIDVQFETGPDIPFIINPDVLIGTASNGQDFIVSPTRGSADVVADGKFMRYRPGIDFLEGEDQFELKVRDLEGNLKNVNVTVRVTDNPCNYNPAFDSLFVSTGESREIDLLANDFFCGQFPQHDPFAVGTQAAVSLQSVSSTYVGSLLDSLDVALSTINNEAKLTVNAPNDPGEIRLIYEIGFVAKPGFRFDNKWQKPGGGLLPQAFEYYLTSEATIRISN